MLFKKGNLFLFFLTLPILKLVNAKCFITGFTALNWAIKHGNQMLVMLLAGTYGADVTCSTHGGYTRGRFILVKLKSIKPRDL